VLPDDRHKTILLLGYRYHSMNVIAVTERSHNQLTVDPLGIWIRSENIDELSRSSSVVAQSRTHDMHVSRITVRGYGRV